MLLGQLLKSVSKNYQKIYVRGISFDSRKVKKRDIFCLITINFHHFSRLLFKITSKTEVYLPMQKSLKILPKISSTSTFPTIIPR